MPIVHERTSRLDLTDRAARLTPGSPRRWGRMTADQMMWHVNAQLEVALGKRECEMIDNLFKRTVIKTVALYGPWPKGKVPTAPEMLAQSSYDLGAERARFGALLAAFAERDVGGPWPPHPAFGPMTGSQWSLLAWRHADHHLSQFSV